MSDSGEPGESGGRMYGESPTELPDSEFAGPFAFSYSRACSFANSSVVAPAEFASACEAETDSRLTINAGSRSERTSSRVMRSVASSTSAERTISAKGAGRSGKENLPEGSRVGRFLVSVSQRETPSDQISDAGKRTDSGAANGSASGHAEEDSPAETMRSADNFTLSPVA